MITQDLTIEEVEAEFTVWRSTKKFRSPIPIPQSLCQQVQRLLQIYPQKEVLRRCGLTLQQARNKGLLPSSFLAPTSLAHGKNEPNPFVKISMPYSSPQKATILNLHCSNKHLSLENPTDEQVQFIIDALLR